MYKTNDGYHIPLPTVKNTPLGVLSYSAALLIFVDVILFHPLIIC